MKSRNSLTSIDQAKAIGSLIFESGLFTGLTSAAQAIVIVLAGMGLHLAPIPSVTGLHIVRGKLVMAATLMAALILRSGRYTYKVKEHSDDRCELEFFRDEQSLGSATFTMDDARRAGLTSNPIWKSYPRNMLFARAMSNGAKWFCADVFCQAVYTPEELAVEQDEAAGYEEDEEEEEEAVDVEFEVTEAAVPEEPQDLSLDELIAETNTNRHRFLEYYRVRDVKDLTPSQQAEARQVLMARMENLDQQK